MNKYKILIIEDDKILAQTLAYNLEKNNYETMVVHAAEEAEKMLTDWQHDLVIMDVNLPDGDGFTLCRKYRLQSNAPLIFLTANDLETDKLKGYDLGGDDYVTKPFSVTIFVKKIDAMLKRITPPQRHFFNDEYLLVNTDNMTVTFETEKLDITPLEFRLLKMLIEHAQTILTRQLLLERLWDIDGNFVDEHALTASMSRLRKKIEIKERKYIKTIYGMGYMWLGENK